MEEIKFAVGETYENVKGVYEVVSIHRDSMVIRWEDGSEATTSLDLQYRIIERMAFEKDLEEQKKAKEKKKKK